MSIYILKYNIYSQCLGGENDSIYSCICKYLQIKWKTHTIETVINYPAKTSLYKSQKYLMFKYVTIKIP